MLRILLPHQLSTQSMVVIYKLANHLDVKDRMGRLPDYYWQAVLSAPTIHVIERHLSPGQSPLLGKCELGSQVDVAAAHSEQFIPWIETRDALCWAQHEFWQSPTENLRGVRVEMVAKMAIDHPELFVDTPQCPSLGESLVTEFRALAADIAVEHPAFGFHPGTAPLSALSFFIGGTETLNLDKMRSFVDSVFSEKRGAALFSDTIKRACRARGIDCIDA